VVSQLGEERRDEHGHGPMRGQGVPVQKSKDLRARRGGCSRCSTERVKLVLALVLGVTSVVFMCRAPDPR